MSSACLQAQEAGWDEGAAVRLQSVPMRLASITTKAPWHLSCAALSPDGRWAACCNTQSIQLYHLSSAPSGKRQPAARTFGKGTCACCLQMAASEQRTLPCIISPKLPGHCLLLLVLLSIHGRCMQLIAQRLMHARCATAHLP